MRDFVKLFRDEEGRQILVVNGEDSNGDPAMKFTVWLTDDGMSVEQFIGFGPDGHDAADRAFERVSEEEARKVSASIREAMRPFLEQAG